MSEAKKSGQKPTLENLDLGLKSVRNDLTKLIKSNQTKSSKNENSIGDIESNIKSIEERIKQIESTLDTIGNDEPVNSEFVALWQHTKGGQSLCLGVFETSDAIAHIEKHKGDEGIESGYMFSMNEIYC